MKGNSETFTKTVEVKKIAFSLLDLKSGWWNLKYLYSQRDRACLREAIIEKIIDVKWKDHVHGDDHAQPSMDLWVPPGECNPGGTRPHLPVRLVCLSCCHGTSCRAGHIQVQHLVRLARMGVYHVLVYYCSHLWKMDNPASRTPSPRAPDCATQPAWFLS